MTGSRRPQRRRDLHLLRRHAAGTRVRVHAARREGEGRRHPDGLLAARRAADRAREPRPRGRVLRDRLRNDRPVDRADAQTRQGRGDDELLVHLQPRDDRAAAAGAARVARPATRRLHRSRPRLHGRRRAAVRVHSGRLRAPGGDLGLRAARHPAVDPDDPAPAGRWPLRGREPVHAGRPAGGQPAARSR